MRVWEKNFLFTLSLFSVLFFVCIFIVASTSFASALNSERETTLREEYILALSMQQNATGSGGNAKKLTAIAAEYGLYYKRKGIYLSLQKDGALLFSNLPVSPGSTAPDETSRTCRTVSTKGEKYLCVEDTLGTGDEKFTFIYLKNIDALYASYKKQAYILLAVGVCTSILFAIALYFTLKKLYSPVNNLAHELRTPLTTIHGYAEYLQNAALSEEDRYTAQKYIIDESDHLSDICDKLLIIANLREGGIHFEMVSIDSLFKNVKMTYENVTYDADETTVRGDKALLLSLVNNLVSNAVRASDPESPVRLRAFNRTIEVSDTGKGMSKETITAIMRANRGTGNRDGNGLGIPLCMQIARLHGAHLSFSSVPGEGTTARVTFTGS